MASLITVRLNKDNSPNWGFRLQGGKDFGTPLIIQKVNSGTPAERAGLIPGDSVIKINNIDVFDLRHKDAQDVVIRAGNNFDMTIQRGGSTWKPSVVPVGTYATHSPSINNLSPVTKTSLHAKPSENIGAIGTGHNLSAKPFSPQLNGSINGGPKLVNKQYNTPLKLYSEESIAETLSAQTEVLSTGALGVNFKKNEKDYDASKSSVYQMLQEAESDPRPNEEPDSGIITTPNSGIAGLRHVSAPIDKPNPPTPQLPPGQNICADCERLIVGVFVRIKDKNLHVECFKCSTCGSSLKNVGYYNINNKLYCDIHAKSAAINNPPAPNLVPVTVQPGGKIPANAISAALATHSLPSPSPLSPKSNSLASPYQPPEIKEPPVPATPSQNLIMTVDQSPTVAPSISNVTPTINNTNNNINNNLYNNSTPVSFSKYLNKSAGFSGPKPFSSVSAPLSPQNTLPRAAPLSPKSPISSAPAPTFSPAPSAGRLPTYSKPSAPLFKGTASGRQTGAIGAPRRGRGVLNAAAIGGSRIPLCGQCHRQIRGPFITALGKIWCPEHFICATPSCRRPLQDIGFVEERGQLYCEYCFEQYLAPPCSKCNGKIKGDCLKAIGKNFHPECFNCAYCGKLFGNSPFFLEDGSPYCEADWNELFTTKCFACGFPVEAGDRWVEALNNNYHSQCFNCTMCKKNLEGQSFFAKGGRPFCKNHAR
ncbi:PDZ and LIM domain protein Zasp isoform X4 [Aethina tumida]|uniref:PDZ and LIM domain protein Zasp isoform X4 n=1 Tax=Aethina tumida TaxID=116153 RepID=UPI0021482B06|nr:PDZ and LIM domain protein Zasp isoform X4 [Aethina tumida]